MITFMFDTYMKTTLIQYSVVQSLLLYVFFFSSTLRGRPLLSYMPLKMAAPVFNSCCTSVSRITINIFLMSVSTDYFNFTWTPKTHWCNCMTTTNHITVSKSYPPINPELLTLETPLNNSYWLISAILWVILVRTKNTNLIIFYMFTHWNQSPFRSNQSYQAI